MSGSSDRLAGAAVGRSDVVRSFPARRRTVRMVLCRVDWQISGRN